jgi:N-methylhydantoinase A
VPFHDLQQVMTDFHQAHLRRFGHALASEVELVNLRVGLSAAGHSFSLTTERDGATESPLEQAALSGIGQSVPVWRRQDLALNTAFAGPLLVIDSVATTFVAPQWAAMRHESGCLLLERD